jgi:hypothetical protein
MQAKKEISKQSVFGFEMFGGDKHRERVREREREDMK